MRASVLREVGADLGVEALADPRPGYGEVLVEVAACGVCHTDLHVMKGEVAFPAPCVLGHEITGHVAELGAGVSGLNVGDRVACSFIMPCGRCRHCVRGHEDLCETFFAFNRLKGTLYDGTSRLADLDGKPIAMYSMGGLAEYAVVPATDVFPLPAGLDLNNAAILGCSVFTSYGAVKNVARLGVGESVAVVAVGGIGLNIVQMAAAFGASTIVAVDVSAEKLALARELGATHVVDASEEDAVARVREITGGRGVDVAFEALGAATTVETAIGSVDDGGRVVLVGIAPAGVTARLNIAHVVRRKIQILGSYGARARTDMPAVLELAATGRIQVDPLITDRFDLDGAGAAYRALDERRIVGRAVVDVKPKD
ncbi:zinc-binding dehydrogenase [Actinopolymorpha alba]|uniref:zinc-binding dehydrogenase n=1 Tax=Actinopolymorpha alba TaxID=533267 RepID=UPI000374D8B4|nr:zinc-binding dehydrogenase [Actinopolymorpha alba]